MRARIIFFTLMLSLPIAAQNFSIKGRVTDSVSGRAVQGAVVFVSYNFLTYTNNDGDYSFKNIPSGNYTVKISRLGYKSVSETIEINSSINIKNINLEPVPIELDEVLVVTNRSEGSLRNSPYSELLIGSNQIETSPVQSLSDLLKDQPGLSLLRDGIWGTEVTIRGLSRENIVAMIDGNRIATSTDVAARLSMIDMNDVERVEVIKGAASSIYGSGATGGIVNIITKTSQMYDRFTLNGNLSMGVNSVNNLSALAGSLYSGGSFWSSKISGSYRKAGNTQTPSGELPNSQFKDYSFSGALNIIPMENNILKLNYQLFKAEDVGIPGASVFPEKAEVRYPDERREMVSGVYEIQNISKLLYKITAKYAYQFIERNVENIPHQVQIVPAAGTTPARRVTVLKITPGAGHKNTNIQLQGNFLIAENNSLVLGIDYWDRSYHGERQKYQLIEVLNSQGNVAGTTNKTIGEKPLPDSKFKSLGLFAQNDAGIVKDKLSLSVGARFDKIGVEGEPTLNPIYEIVSGTINYSPAGQIVLWNKIDGNEVSYSGNVGLKYSVNPNLDLTLSLGYSFRSPSLEERFQYIDQGSSVRVGNPNLNPEKGKSADLGLRYYSPDFKLISSVFYNYFDDLLAELPGTFEGRAAFIKTNVGQARLYGFDLHADYNFYKDYVLYATGSYVKGEDLTVSGSLPEIPPFNGNLGIKFSFLKTVEADFSATIFAEQNNVAAGEMTTPGYAYINFFANLYPFKLGIAELRITAGVENLLNKEYRNHLSTGRGLIKEEPGRNLFVKVNLSW